MRPDTVGPMTVVVLDILPWDERLMLDLAPAEIGMIEIEAGVKNSTLIPLPLKRESRTLVA